MEKKYWTENGTYQSICDELSCKMPDWGYTENPYLNLFIAISNLYYDLYNNGGGNVKDCYEKAYRKYIVPYFPNIFLEDFEPPQYARAEAAMDSVLLFLKDKNVSYEKFTCWFDSDQGLLCRTERTGSSWSPITFGLKSELDEWIERRKENLGHEEVT